MLIPKDHSILSLTWNYSPQRTQRVAEEQMRLYRKLLNPLRPCGVLCGYYFSI
jgi:hypothetical protein